MQTSESVQQERSARASQRIRVIRVLEIEGERGWVAETLRASVVSKGQPYRTYRGQIREIAREEAPNA